jgi:hypothetical protein
MVQLLTSAGIILSVYALLYAMQFGWNLLCKAPVAFDKRRDDTISDLIKEIETLRKRPYEQAHEDLARQKVAALGEAACAVLRHILHHPWIQARAIPQPDGPVLAIGCYNQGLLDRREDRPGNGTVVMATYYAVKDTFRPVLEDIFYPRKPVKP